MVKIGTFSLGTAMSKKVIDPYLTQLLTISYTFMHAIFTSLEKSLFDLKIIKNTVKKAFFLWLREKL